MNTNVFRRTHSDRYAAFGQTSASRHLTVIFALGPGRVARVITAREMDDKERRYYNRERRG